MITHVKYEISVDFEGVSIVVEYSDWESQPDREKFLSIKIFDGDGKELKYATAPYKFIETRFRKSELFKGIVERFKFKCI